MPQWSKTLKLLADLENTESMRIIMTAAVRWEKPRPVLIRQGDISAGAANPSAVEPGWTAIFCAFQVLCFSTVSPDSKTRRFPTSISPSAYFGFEADAWFRALFAVAFFFDRRNGKKYIDRQSGQYDRKQTLQV